MKILQNIDSELLPRKELTVIIEHATKPTPSNKEVLEILSNNLKADKETIRIKHIYSTYGEGKSKVIAYIYKDKDSLFKIEKFSKKEKEELSRLLEKPQEQKTEEKPQEPEKQEQKPENQENGQETKEEQKTE
jgi:ribosomal protein S24E